MIMDHTPPWLVHPPPFVSRPPWDGEPIEIEVDLSEFVDLEQTHRMVAPRQKNWTLDELRAHKEELIELIRLELDRQDEVSSLREECANLAMGLEWLKLARTHHKTVSFP